MITRRQLHHALVMFIVITICSGIMPTHAGAQGYENSLHGVNSFAVVYDVSQGNPRAAEAVFWAVRNSYENASVNKLATPPHIAVVFRGPAAKLISTERNTVDPDQQEAVEKFQATLRQMKKAGVTLEVCLYAVKLAGLDKAKLMPEINQVDNGFVSIIGYQMQGYAAIHIP